MDGDEAVKKAYESILMHDFEQAVVWFERAIALKPDSAAYHFKLSITYARSNKLEKAIHYAREAARLDPDDEHYALHLQLLQAKELVHQAEKLFDEKDDRLWLAVELLKQAQDFDPLCTEAMLLLGVAYSRLKEYNKAVQSVKELLKLDPHHEIGTRLLTEYQLLWKQYMQTASPVGVQSERNGAKDESRH